MQIDDSAKVVAVKKEEDGDGSLNALSQQKLNALKARPIYFSRAAGAV